MGGVFEDGTNVFVNAMPDSCLAGVDVVFGEADNISIPALERLEGRKERGAIVSKLETPDVSKENAGMGGVRSSKGIADE